MNVRVSGIAFDVNLVDVCSVNNQNLVGAPQLRTRTHSETKPLGCTLLERPKTTSLDFGLVESIRVRVGFPVPWAKSSYRPKLRRDKHKYIFGVTGPELDSAVAAYCGSPGQKTIELSGCASHLRGGRGLVDRSSAVVSEFEGKIASPQNLHVLSPSNPRRTSHSSTLDAWTQLSQSAYSARWTL